MMLIYRARFWFYVSKQRATLTLVLPFFSQQIFQGYKPSVLTMQHELKREIIGPVYIRLNVKDAPESLGLRFELYGCKRK